MDCFWAVGSRKRVLFKVGNESEPSDLGQIESQPLDLIQDLIFAVNRTCGPRNYSMDRVVASMDRTTDPPCIEDNKIYFLEYFGLIFTLIFA